MIVAGNYRRCCARKCLIVRPRLREAPGRVVGGLEEILIKEASGRHRGSDAFSSAHDYAPLDGSASTSSDVEWDSFPRRAIQSHLLGRATRSLRVMDSDHPCLIVDNKYTGCVAIVQVATKIIRLSRSGYRHTILYFWTTAHGTLLEQGYWACPLPSLLVERVGIQGSEKRRNTRTPGEGHRN